MPNRRTPPPPGSPGAVGDRERGRQRRSAHVIPIWSARRWDTATEHQLDALLADARAHVEGELLERSLHPLPPLGRSVQPAPATAARSRPRFLSWAGAAAALLIASTLGATAQRAAEATNIVPYQAALAPDHATPRLTTVRDTPTRAAPIPTLEPADTPAPEPVTTTGTEAQTMKKSDRPRRVKPQRSLARLDALAARRWRNGDPHGAERALRELVRRGRRGRRVQLAYGDLFVLVRETHGRAAEPALWREYLKRFPRGPHADDARAGLCRRAAEGERARCWRAYVDAFPSGAHVGVAARALAHASSRDRSRQRQ